MINTYKRSLIIISIIFLVLLLGCCAPQPQSSDPSPQATALPTPTASPTMAATQVSIDGYQPITPQNIQDMELITELGSGKTYEVALSPDGKTIAVLGQYNIAVYDRETFREKYRKSVNFDNPSTITFTPNGDQIVYSNNFTIFFIDTESGETTNTLRLINDYRQIREISFTPDLDRIIVKGDVTSRYCDGRATKYAMYTLNGFKLFDYQVCSFLAHEFTKPINEKQTIFISNYGTRDGIPYERYIVENETGNVLAAEYYRREPDDGTLTKTTFGNVSLFPSETVLSEWMADDLYNEYAHLPSQCFAPDSRIIVYKVLGEDETSALLVFKRSESMIISDLDLTTCQYSESPLFISQFYSAGEFSPDDKHFVYANSLNTNLLNMERNEHIYSEPLSYIQNNNANYEFTADGTKILVWFKEHQIDPVYEVSGFQLGILDANTGKVIDSFFIPGSDIYEIVATSNPSVILLIPRKTGALYSLWNIETKESIVALPDGEYLFDASRNAILILYTDDGYYHNLSLIDLSTGKLIFQNPTLEYERNATMELIENNSLLKINYQIDRLTHAEMIFDIENRTILSDTIETREIISGDDHTSDYSIWSFSKIANNAQILLQYANSYTEERPLSESNSIIITEEHRFWDKETGQYIGQLDTDFEIEELFFSPNHYYMTAIGSDGIIRIYGVKEE